MKNIAYEFGKLIICLTIAILISVGIGAAFRYAINKNLEPEQSEKIEQIVNTPVMADETSNLTKIENSAPYTGIYDFRDPETGIHYLIVARTSSGTYTTCSITPRLDKDGNIMKD